MNAKDKRVVSEWAGLINQLASNVDAGLNAAVKDVTVIEGLRNIAIEMRSTAEGC